MGWDGMKSNEMKETTINIFKINIVYHDLNHFYETVFYRILNTFRYYRILILCIKKKNVWSRITERFFGQPKQIPLFHCQSVYIMQFALTFTYTLANALRCMCTHFRATQLSSKAQTQPLAQSHILAVFSSVRAWILSQSAQPGYDTVGMQKIALSPQAKADLCQNIK